MSEGDNQSRRNFLTKTMTLVGGAGAGAVVFPLVSSMAPSEKAKAAGAPVKVDISNLNEGEKILPLLKSTGNGKTLIPSLSKTRFALFI